MDVTVRLNTAVPAALSVCPAAVKTLTVDTEPAALLAVSVLHLGQFLQDEQSMRKYVHTLRLARINNVSAG